MQSKTKPGVRQQEPGKTKTYHVIGLTSNNLAKYSVVSIQLNRFFVKSCEKNQSHYLQSFDVHLYLLLFFLFYFVLFLLLVVVVVLNYDLVFLKVFLSVLCNLKRYYHIKLNWLLNQWKTKYLCVEKWCRCNSYVFFSFCFIKT